MLKVGSFFFPAGETHFTQFGDAVEDYGKLDRTAAYRYVRRWRRALDVGANVGIFARDFAARFDEVVAFEPVNRTRECLAVNVPPNVRIEPYAVADQPGVLQMYPVIMNSGGSFICNHPQVPTGEMVYDREQIVEVPVRTIDSYHFDAVDLIKLDIQGAEYPAIVGAKRTIRQHRPVILLEQKAAVPEQAEWIKRTSRLLRSWGMTAKEKAKSDRVFVFEE